MPTPFVHDLYAPLSHKQPLTGTTVRAPGVASWVPTEDARRLAAYRLLAAYRDNVARNWLPDSVSADARDKYREYGHAGLLIAQGRAALLGDEQTVDVPEAGFELADGAQPTAEQARATAAADWLQTWAVKERLWLKIGRAERDALTLGDGVYALGWDPVRGRPRLRTYDPGFYFPVLTGDQDEYPSRVHIAWEQQQADGTVELHRLTWSLGRIRPRLDPDYPPGERVHLYDEQGRPVPQDGDQLITTPEGFLQLVRRYPWAADGAAPSTVTCHFTHAIYDLAKSRGTLLDLTDPQRYEITEDGTVLHELDLRLDFVPVVHVPCDDGGDEHFGRSLLMLIAQVLDDLNNTDSDLAANSQLVGSATLVTTNGPAQPVGAGPGSHLDLPPGGTAGYLDTSRNLDALLKYLAELQQTLSVNSRLSQAVLGRIDASDVPSGIALAWSFRPTQALISEMRNVRDEKYPLLLKFALRMAQSAGLVPAGPTPDARIVFGSFMPADRAAALEEAARGLEGGVMSTLTAVRLLVDAGFPIDDAQEEVKRIRAESFAKAVELLDATGDEAVVRDFLGLDPAEDPPAGA